MWHLGSYQGTVGKGRSAVANGQNILINSKHNLANLAEKLGPKCLSNLFTACILAYTSWLPVTVQVCAGFLQHECVLALIQYVCILFMVSCGTGVCFTVLVMVSHSTCVCWQFSWYVCVLVMVSHSTWVCWKFLKYMCVLIMFSHSMCVCWHFTVCVCTDHGLPQHMCVLVVLQYVGVLFMVSCEHVLTWLTAPQLCSWHWFLHFLSCPVTQNMFAMRHTVT